MRPRCRLVICADDLTGACECAANLAQQGYDALLVTDWRAFDPLEDAEVIAVNTRSRHEIPDTAAQRVATVAARARSAGVSYFYKKTDSASRGHIGAELTAALAFLDPEDEKPVLPYVPAAPSAGRTVENGQLLIRGTPVHRTAFADDPQSPVKTSDLRTMLEAETSIPVEVCAPDDVLPSPSEHACFVLFNGRTEEDLASIASALRATRTALLAGTGIFMNRLSDVFELGDAKAKEPPAIDDRPVLILNGSLSAEALAQLRFAVARGWPAEQLSPAAMQGSASQVTLATAITEKLRMQRRFILHTGSNRDEARSLESALGKETPDTSVAHRRIRECMGAIAREIVERNASPGPVLVLNGGETAQAVLDALEIRSARVSGELEQGLAVLESRYGENPLTLITKNGAFGSESVYIDHFANPSASSEKS